MHIPVFTTFTEVRSALAKGGCAVRATLVWVAGNKERGRTWLTKPKSEPNARFWRCPRVAYPSDRRGAPGANRALLRAKSIADVSTLP